MLQFFYHFMDSEYRFCFTLDTEPDDLWARRPALSFEQFNVLPGFQDLIVESGGRPTYLIAIIISLVMNKGLFVFDGEIRQ